MRGRILICLPPTHYIPEINLQKLKVRTAYQTPLWDLLIKLKTSCTKHQFFFINVMHSFLYHTLIAQTENMSKKGVSPPPRPHPPPRLPPRGKLYSSRNEATLPLTLRTRSTRFRNFLLCCCLSCAFFFFTSLLRN